MVRRDFLAKVTFFNVISEDGSRGRATWARPEDKTLRANTGSSGQFSLNGGQVHKGA